MDELLKFDPYEASIDYNPHKGMHQSIEEYFDDKDSFIDYDECIQQGRVFVVRVYPRTAVSFFEICGSDYKATVEKMCEVLRHEV